MASDTSLVFNLVARERVSDALASVKEKFAATGRLAGRGLAAGFATTAGAGIATAVAGVAGGAIAAGVAVKAFTTAAQPQLDSVAEAWELYTAKQDAAAAGGEEAAAAVKAYKDALAEMTPATRTTAEAFVGLKSDFQEWSDGLSSTTMPVFTQGIEILRDLLPTLTPFVEAAAGALGGFLDEVAAGVASADFKTWAADMSAVAGPALSDFLATIKNLAVGFGGLLAAFAPTSAGVTGGLVEMSAAFRDWGTSLQGSEGFAQFLAFAEDGQQTLGNLAGAALDLGIALAPLLGTTTMLLTLFAQLISAVPTPVLTALATTIATVTIGMKLYAAGSAVVATANTLMASTAYTAIAGWVRMQAVVVGAMIRMAAAATVNAARTAGAWAMAAARATATWLATMIRVAAVTVARFAMMAARAVIWAATMAAQWLIAMGPIGWIIAAVIALAVLIIANWDKIKKHTLMAWNWVWGKIKAVSRVIAGFVARWAGRIVGYWQDLKSGAINKARQLVSWVTRLPGRLMRAVGNLRNLLVGKGMDIVRGLWSGIKSMGSWLRSTLMGWARDLVPGPIADALGISSPSKVLADEVGRWVPAGISLGITSNLDQVRAAARAAADAAVPARSGGPLAHAGGGPGPVAAPIRTAGRPLLVTVQIGDREFGQLWIDTGREEIRKLGGTVQAVIGQKGATR